MADTIRRWDGAQWVMVYDKGTFLPLNGTLPMTGDLTLYRDPISTGFMNAVTKQYADNLVLRHAWKDNVHLATTDNITLSGTSNVIDGYLIGAGGRVLVKDQTTGSENGIYDVFAGPWVRAWDADSVGDIFGAAVLVSQGATNKDTVWACVTDPPEILSGATPQQWTQIAGDGKYVKKSGDSMSNMLHISYADSEKIRLYGFTQSYISGYTLTGTSERIGYLQFAEGVGGVPPHIVRLFADTGNNVELYTSGAVRLTASSTGISIPGAITAGSLTSAGVLPITAGTTLSLTAGGAGNVLITGGSSNGSVIVSGGGSAGGLLFTAATTGGIDFRAGTSSGNIVFETSNTARMRLLAGGTIVMGKSASDVDDGGFEFQSTKSLFLTRTDLGAPLGVTMTSASSAVAYVAFRSPVSTALTTVDVIAYIRRVGTTNAVQFTTISDERWKGNIRDIDDDEALDFIDRLRPRAYQERHDNHGRSGPTGNPNGPVIHGFVAQELNEVQPLAVVPPDNDGEPWMSGTAVLIPDLVAAVQALVRQVKSLKEEVATLKKN